MAYSTPDTSLMFSTHTGAMVTPALVPPNTTTGLYLREDGRIVNGAQVPGVRVVALLPNALALDDFVVSLGVF